ncbi:hypothetical protein H4R19_006791, partial [Coemansia spiralis]
ALAEVKKGSSIDPNISVVRCLLCKGAVVYFRGADAGSMPLLPAHPTMQQQPQRQHGLGQQQRAMPAPHATVYLAKDVKDARAIAESEKASTYSEPFGVVLDPELVGKLRGQVHVPRDLHQRATEYMRQQETEKNNRIRAFVQEQDAALEQLRARTDEQSSIVARLVAQVHKEPAPSARSVSGATSGLAAMLRGSGSGPGPGSADASLPMANPFARAALPRNGHADHNNKGDDDDGASSDYAMDDPFLRDGGELSNMLEPPARSRPFPIRRTPSQSGDESELDGAEDTQWRTGGGGGVLSQMMVSAGPAMMTAGSMPVQIPAYGSSSMSTDPFVSRRELLQRSDELEMHRRRQKIMRGMPSTFIPPHKLMDSINENDAEMFIGSKPKDAYLTSRHH